MPITRVELVTISKSNYTKYLAQSAADYFAFWKISTANLWILWRHLPTELWSGLCVESTSCPLTESENSVKSMHNWRRCPSSNWYKIDQKMRFKISRSSVAPSDATEKNRNMGAQLQSLLCPKIFRKIYFLYDFWCAQTCLFRAIFGLPMRNLTIAAGAILRSTEKKYRCTSTCLALKYCGGFLLTSQLSIWSCAHKLFRRFLNFSQFLAAISRKLWRQVASEMRTI